MYQVKGVRKNNGNTSVRRIKLTEKTPKKIFKNSLAFLKQSGYNEAMHKQSCIERYRIRMKGKVKMFNQEKGYGFITKEDGKDVFFHYSQLMMEGFKTIDNDVEVEFEEVETDRGPQAHNIIKL